MPPTFVALQYLCDVSRLQVPDVDLGIFASANNVLATRIAKSSYQTVCSIRVSRIRFDTS